MIEINTSIIEKLETLIYKEFEKLHVETVLVPLEECFDITIGRTPPRAEKRWFSLNENDEKWISIKDMGQRGLYIYDSNEKLTNDAINKFNYVYADKNDILMSFKLTVGRLSIAGTKMVTNEAIACFKPKDALLRWYLLCYLNHCDFTNAGSTSSIATAINSSILKKYPFPKPLEDISSFDDKVNLYISEIDAYSRKNIELNKIKDSYLKQYFG